MIAASLFAFSCLVIPWGWIIFHSAYVPCWWLWQRCFFFFFWQHGRDLFISGHRGQYWSTLLKKEESVTVLASLQQGWGIESIGCLKAAIHEEHQYFELTMSENGQDPFQMFKLSMGRKSWTACCDPSEGLLCYLWSLQLAFIPLSSQALKFLLCKSVYLTV